MEPLSAKLAKLVEKWRSTDPYYNVENNCADELAAVLDDERWIPIDGLPPEGGLSNYWYSDGNKVWRFPEQGTREAKFCCPLHRPEPPKEP